jgi:hypothetical protein
LKNGGGEMPEALRLFADILATGSPIFGNIDARTPFADHPVNGA